MAPPADFDSFDNAARALLLDHAVLGSELHRRMTSVLRRASEGLPTVKVLYCDSHGGFGYSKPFATFIKEAGSGGDHSSSSSSSSSASAGQAARRPKSYDTGRLRAMELLGPFGLQVATRWPLVGRLVQAYVRHDLGTHFNLVRGLGSSAKTLASLERKQDLVARLVDAGGFGTCTEVPVGLLYAESSHREPDLQRQDGKLSLATLQQLQALLQEEVHTVRTAPAMLLDTHGERFLDAMQSSLAAPYPDDDDAADAAGHDGKRKRQHSGYSSWHDTAWFIDSLEELGEAHPAIWDRQELFDSAVMRHLLRCPDHLDRLLLRSPGDAAPTADLAPPEPSAYLVQLGLCAGSTQHCNLQICEVPQLMEWTLVEYGQTGWETIEFGGCKETGPYAQGRDAARRRTATFRAQGMVC